MPMVEYAHGVKLVFTNRTLSPQMLPPPWRTLVAAAAPHRRPAQFAREIAIQTATALAIYVASREVMEKQSPAVWIAAATNHEITTTATF
jgi:hypothetical protein